MCTALTLKTSEGTHLFGRNMDIEFSFNQSVGIIPRSFEYKNMSTNELEKTKYAIIGMITVIDNHPMLADGLNEKGLACAGLNFPGYAHWESELAEGKINVPAYDFMLWVLSNFETLEELKPELEKINLLNSRINNLTPPPTLHWIITDKTGESIVIEKTKSGLRIFNNEVGVLTNSPTFDWHITNLRQYIGLSSNQVTNAKWSTQELKALGQGVGCVGIPGDFTPASRFVRTAFLRHFALANDKDSMNISEFFHILNNVAMVRGSVRTPDNRSDITQYTSCMNQEKGIYYYNTYNNNNINAIDMHKEDLNAKEIKLFNYEDTLKINNQN